MARDPTSHNLFPFEVVLGALAASAYLGAIAVLRWIGRRLDGGSNASLS